MIDPQTAATVIADTTAALQTQDGESIRAGVWVTAAGVITAIIGAVVVYMNQRRSWMDSADNARNEDFRRLREEIARRDKDMDEMQADMKAMRAKVDDAAQRAAAMQLKVVQLQMAFQLVSGELGRKDPDNSVLKQARDLIASAAMGDEDVLRTAIASLSNGRQL